ncbi:ATP synthase F1 subunit gamma [Lachnoclostridium phytofermentans]|uniref:ATP synthase gamma chain n=1 Tax=Lachnoclostridium phytofermentans (strain ATCC 700394 / DSM 18823 / ISDg) TaxID=357809 RepID=ATPG_LACP7|nr:ATP synthase F1 subunit gamma [Lachnoclostridium phytofermentans]A9KK93.1 RecName: Full=ATP synthase gamma chain; AltName: Full=ATP synthase F1 sector gamma subunit; AltName: Full=F-ATPase gamma subunit [Lachnoclostridium phytofermentans ISDg]ABX44084.1 ATP synthase F1, gamma subunit [Lachnoclostridium phytofermentans ISDg]
MASMRDIKRRKESIQSTGQITKAMKLVSTVKLQKAKSKAENAKPYFDHMYDTVLNMLRKSGNISHPYLSAGKSNKKAIIVITSNRGLAGGYNSNILKLVMSSDINKEDAVVYAVGRKGKEALARRGYHIAKDYSEVMNAPIYKDAIEIGKAVLDAFVADEVGEIYLAYTSFKNTVSHEPTLIKLLPVDMEAALQEGEKSEDLNERLTLMNYEPAAEEALNLIIPKYINSLIYGALVQALASENGARMQAMDSATNNAEDMISDLSLKYNRARQSSITQELTEIIAGANAIN